MRSDIDADTLLGCLKWSLFISALGAFLAAGVFLFYVGRGMSQGFKKSSEGEEYSISDGQQNLAGALDGYFGWPHLQKTAVKGCWTNGFREHTRLYRVEMDDAAFRSLKAAVANSSDRTHAFWSDQDSVESGLSSAQKPWNPGQPRIPAWWSVDKRSNLDVVSWKAPEKPEKLGLFVWMAFDSSDDSLFVCSWDY